LSAPRRILIVDADRRVVERLRDALTAELGHVVVGIAPTSADAISLTSTEAPDLVLSEIPLEGDVDGIDTARIIQGQFGVPVVYLTANTDPAVLERALQTEPHGYLAKPFHARTLGATIAVALRRHESETTLRGHTAELAKQQVELVEKSKELGALAERFRQQSILDPLTNLYNRRHLDTVLKRELSLAQREGHAVGLIMFDVDRFKAVNDAFGHAAGDKVLQDIAHYLRSRLRAYDVACRYGGEEVAIVLPGAPLADAMRVAEHLRAGIESLAPVDNGRPIGSVTASFGVAAFPDQGTEPDQLLRSADEALYVAKGEGRNRVVAARLKPTR
jgi:diguanylate cyclase (GGDEF)-like protein